MATFKNVTPNPLNADGTLNKKYSNTKYATSDFSGIENTVHLKEDINTAVIMNQYVTDNLYMPGIGELGAAMENIEKINNGIARFADPESDEINFISLNANYASSTLRTPVSSPKNSNYQKSNTTISEVWYYTTTYAEIAYGPIIDKYSTLGFYRYIPESDEEFNAINTTDQWNYTLVVEEKEPTELKFNSSNYSESTYNYYFEADYIKSTNKINDATFYSGKMANESNKLGPNGGNPSLMQESMDLFPIICSNATATPKRKTTENENSVIEGLFGFENNNIYDGIFLLPREYNNYTDRGIISYLGTYTSNNPDSTSITGEETFTIKFNGNNEKSPCFTNVKIKYLINILDKPLLNPNLIIDGNNYIRINTPYNIGEDGNTTTNNPYINQFNDCINNIKHKDKDGNKFNLTEGEINKLKINCDKQNIIDKLKTVGAAFGNPENNTIPIMVTYPKQNIGDNTYKEQTLRIDLIISLTQVIKTTTIMKFAENSVEYDKNLTNKYYIPELTLKDSNNNTIPIREINNVLLNNAPTDGVSIQIKYNGSGGTIIIDGNATEGNRVAYLSTGTNGTFCIEASFDGNDQYKPSYASCDLYINADDSSGSGSTESLLTPELRYDAADDQLVFLQNSSHTYDIPNLIKSPSGLKVTESARLGTITSNHKLKYQFTFGDTEDSRLVTITASSTEQTVGDKKYRAKNASITILISKEAKNDSKIVLSATEVKITKKTKLSDVKVPTVNTSKSIPGDMRVSYSVKEGTPNTTGIGINSDGTLKFLDTPDSEYITMSNNGSVTINVIYSGGKSNGTSYNPSSTSFTIIVNIKGTVLDDITNNFKNNIFFFQDGNTLDELKSWVTANSGYSMDDIINNPNKFMYTIWNNPIYTNSFLLNSRWANETYRSHNNVVTYTDYEAPNFIIMIPSYIDQWYSSFSEMEKNLTIKVTFIDAIVGTTKQFTMSKAGKIKDTLVYGLFLDKANLGFLRNNENASDSIKISLYKKSNDTTAALEKTYFFNPYTLRFTQPENTELNNDIRFGNYYSLGYCQKSGATGYRFNNLTGMPKTINVMNNLGEHNSYINSYFSGKSGSTYLGSLRVDRFAYHVTNANNRASFSGIQRININSKYNIYHGLSIGSKTSNIRIGENIDFQNIHIVLRSFFNKDRFGIFNDCVLNDFNKNYVLSTNDDNSATITVSSTGSTVYKKDIPVNNKYVSFTYGETYFNYKSTSKSYMDTLKYEYYVPTSQASDINARIYNVDFTIKNLPITGVKQILYTDLTDRFTDGNYVHGNLFNLPLNSNLLPLNKFTDYLFIHNDSDTKSVILFTDESQTLAFGTHTIILDPHETLEYFPQVRDKLPIVFSFSTNTELKIDGKTHKKLNENKIFEYYSFKDIYNLNNNIPILTNGTTSDGDLSLDRIYQYNCSMNYVYQYFNLDYIDKSTNRPLVREYGTNEIYRILNIPTRINHDVDIANILIDLYGRDNVPQSATAKFYLSSSNNGARIRKTKYDGSNITKRKIRRFPVYTTDKFLGGSLILITKDRTQDIKCKLYFNETVGYYGTSTSGASTPRIYGLGVWIAWGSASQYGNAESWGDVYKPNATDIEKLMYLSNHTIFFYSTNVQEPSKYPGNHVNFIDNMNPNLENIEDIGDYGRDMGNYDRVIFAKAQVQIGGQSFTVYSQAFKNDQGIISFNNNSLFDEEHGLKAIRVGVSGSVNYENDQITDSSNLNINIYWNAEYL